MNHQPCSMISPQHITAGAQVTPFTAVPCGHNIHYINLYIITILSYYRLRTVWLVPILPFSNCSSLVKAVSEGCVSNNVIIRIYRE